MRKRCMFLVSTLNNCFIPYVKSKKTVILLVFVLCVVIVPAGATNRDTDYFIDIIAQNRVITYDEVREMKDANALRLMRNAVYARCGYIFSDKTLTSYFAKYKWYKPRFRDVNARLSSNDKSNLEMIIFFENGVRFRTLLKKNFPGYAPVDGAAEKVLIGVWQNAPVMASGWSDTYAFYANRKVVKRGNQMDCEKRELWKMGNWRLDKGSLVIEYFATGRIEGGRLVEAAGSCATDQELIDGTYVIVDISPVEKEEMPVSKIEVRKDADIQRRSMMIGETRFWLMTTDPEQY
ncbi:MAG TPA: YARHG domain-containing protein [Spirochaetota bacterium]|nr:YARHG domain-containing protein [Spirochaetota bacterium]